MRPPIRAAEEALTHIGQHLADWRKLQGLTQAQVAARAGVSRGVVVRLEAGAPGVSTDGLVRVVHAMHRTDDLVDALDPLNTAVGRARAAETLPQRVRRAR